MNATDGDTLAKIWAAESGPGVDMGVAVGEGVGVAVAVGVGVGVEVGVGVGVVVGVRVAVGSAVAVGVGVDVDEGVAVAVGAGSAWAQAVTKAAKRAMAHKMRGALMAFLLQAGVWTDQSPRVAYRGEQYRRGGFSVCQPGAYRPAGRLSFILIARSQSPVAGSYISP